MNLEIAQKIQTNRALTSPAEFVERAKTLAPSLRERAAHCEELRRVPEETIADYIRLGLIRATQPARFGGAEAGWDTLCDITQILAASCGSQAWIQRIMSDHAQMVATFPEAAQNDVWSKNHDALVAASFDPTGRAQRVDGGFRLSGRHGFSSGIDYAHWLICGGYIIDGEQKDGPHFFLVPREDVTIIDDWNTMGLAGTGSKSFEVKDAFVPAHRFLDGKLAQQGAGPGTAVNTAVVYRIPRSSGITSSGFSALAVGMAKGVLNEWINATATRKSRGARVAERQTTHEILARSSGEIDAAEALYMTSLHNSAKQIERGEKITPLDRARSKRNVSMAAQLCLQAGTRLFNAAGGRALFLDDPMQRQYRNLLGAVSHHGLVWETAAADYGSLILKERMNQ